MATTTANSIEKNELDLESNEGHSLGRRVIYSLSAAQFEMLYLQPGGQKAHTNLTSKLGNPTLLGLISFLICATTLSIECLGLGGMTIISTITLAGGAYFVGGLGLFIAGLLEFLLGNTFVFTVFCSLATFWLSFGFILQPSQLIASSVGPISIDYNFGIAIYLCSWAFLVLLYAIAALRTNIIFVLTFLFLELNLTTLIGAYFQIGQGSMTIVPRLLKVSGSFGVLTVACGWYLLIVNLFATVGLAQLPVGDLSGFLTKKSDTKEA